MEIVGLAALVLLGLAIVADMARGIRGHDQGWPDVLMACVIIGIFCIAIGMLTYGCLAYFP